ncbi:MAG: hypothetical protein LKE27_11180 [Atopobiaceae bacterium]|nr:hypothetical protein [Atopobiaceae bacterium]
MSASEIEKAESRAKAKAPRQHAEECRLEAAGHCRKAREADPEKSIRECAAEPGTSDKTPSGWAIRHGRTGKATQAIPFTSAAKHEPPRRPHNSEYCPLVAKKRRTNPVTIISD